MISINNTEIIPTIFPDGTAQVWKLPNDIINFIKTNPDKIVIEWNYQSDAELIYVLMLRDLLVHLCENKGADIVLYCPYLPYARQDKDISNETTWGLATFMDLLRPFDEVVTVDVHNPEYFKYSYVDITNLSAEALIADATQKCDANYLCYPDLGAASRYSRFNNKVRSCVMKKVRDQLTGEITGLNYLHTPPSCVNDNVLLIDDICDGGRTFIEATKVLTNSKPNSINLYVTHGIFSKGFDILHEAGINKIFTMNGLVSEAETV